LNKSDAAVPAGKFKVWHLSSMRARAPGRNTNGARARWTKFDMEKNEKQTSVKSFVTF
jgi:hypothetical protein